MVAAVCCCRQGHACLSASGHGGEYSGPRPPHGAYAATISNGLGSHAGDAQACSERRTRLRLCDAPHGASNLQSHSGDAAPRGHGKSLDPHW